MAKGNNTLQAFWVAMGSLSSMSLSLISAAILSRYFEKAEYGTYKQIVYIYNTLLIVFAAGLPQVFAYYLPRYTIAQGKNIVWKITKILFFLGLLFSILLFVTSGLIAEILNNPELKIGLKVFSPIPMFLLPTLGVEGIFSTYQKTIYIAIYNTVTRLLMLSFIVLPVVLFEGSYLYALYGWIIASIISSIIAFYFKSIPFKETKGEKSDLNYKEIFAYSLPLVFGTIGGIALKAGDQFYISRYFGAEVFAEFSNGFIPLPFTGMITGAAATVLMPVFSRIKHQQANLTEIGVLFKSTIIKSASLIYPLIVFSIFNAKGIIILLYSQSYIESVIYFQIALGLNFFNIITLSPILFALNETKYYARLIGSYAILFWLLGYLTIVMFNSPILIALLSVTIFGLIIFTGLYRCCKLINITLINLVPFGFLLKLILHSIFSIIASKMFINQFIAQDQIILSLILTLILFSIILLSTAKILKLDYLAAVQPLLNKVFPNKI